MVLDNEPLVQDVVIRNGCFSRKLLVFVSLLLSLGLTTLLNSASSSPFRSKQSPTNQETITTLAWQPVQSARAWQPSRFQPSEVRLVKASASRTHGFGPQENEFPRARVSTLLDRGVFQHWPRDKLEKQKSHDRLAVARQALSNDAGATMVDKVRSIFPKMDSRTVQSSQVPARNASSPRVPPMMNSLGLEHDVASPLHDQVGLKDTEELQRKVLEVISNALGPEHPDTLASKDGLALILQAHGDLKGSEKLQREVLEARLRTQGPDSPDTLASKNNLARVLLNGGDLDAAKKMSTEIMDAISRNLSAVSAKWNHEVPMESEDNVAELQMPESKAAAKSLSPSIVKLNKALVDVIKGVIDTMYKGRDIQRFYVLETVARVPYFAYVSCLHMYESLGKRGNTEQLRLHYAEADNELHHLLIMEALGGNEAYFDRFFAQHMAVFYYWYCIAVYMVHPRAAYHLSELIEEHAFHTYDNFLEAHASKLQKQPVPSIARDYYSGRDTLQSYLSKFEPHKQPEGPRMLKSLYDVFAAIRDDEGAHWRTLSHLVQHPDDLCPTEDACVLPQ